MVRLTASWQNVLQSSISISLFGLFSLTVASMDVLVPGVGELIGGSQREERYDLLCGRMDEVGLDKSVYEWYLDLRKYGTSVHSGFGLGFERMILLTTGMENIRDVIP